jgi:hypothetical protein
LLLRRGRFVLWEDAVRATSFITRSNFRKWMSQWMDRPVEGALGGSALRYFRVTVDYPNAVAVFEQAGGGP